MAQGPIRVHARPAVAALTPDPLDFLRRLGGPAWIRVEGRDPTRTRAVSTLLHGNEPSGLRAVHAWLRSGDVPAVNAVFLLGAVEAALAAPGLAHRALPGRRDLNRCFLPPFEGAEGRIAQEALRLLREAGPECLVDLHNNTGHNPAYGVGPRTGTAELNLVALFADRFVHSDLRLGALVEATHGDFPSVTIECGRAGDPGADATARAGLERLLSGAPLAAGLRARRMRVLEEAVRVGLRKGLRLAYAEGPVPGADLTIARDVDRHNFEELAPGTAIGWIGSGEAWPLEARDGAGREVSQALFAVRDGVLEVRRSLVPIMMTTDPAIALGDCLFYAVQPGPVLRGGA